MHRLLINGVNVPILRSMAPVYIEANSVADYSPGKSSKTGTLEVPFCREVHQALGVGTGEMYDRRAYLNKVIEGVIYESGNIRYSGNLYVSAVGEYSFKGIFVAGNGLFVASLEEKLLSDLDFSSWEHTLTPANVLASESNTLPYIYDFADRGRWENTDTVDITERFPAIRITALLGLVFKGWTLVGDKLSEIANDFLLFTQSEKVNNSEEWAETSPFRAGDAAHVQTVDVNDTGLQTAEIVLTFPQVEDAGDNYDPATGIYQTSEAGTYRFRARMTGTILWEGSGATNPNLNALTLRLQIYDQTNSSIIHEVVYIVDAGSLMVGSYDFDCITLDTNYIYHPGNRNVVARVFIEADIPGPSPHLPITFTLSLDELSHFRGDVKRWFGTGQTVDFSKVVPQIQAKDFIADVCRFYGLQLYTNINEKTAYFFPVSYLQSDDLDVNGRIGAVSYDEIPPLTNYVVAMEKDSSDIMHEAAADVDFFVEDNDVGASRTETINLPYTRTFFRPPSGVQTFGMYNPVPRLWRSGNPNAFLVEDPADISDFSTSFSPRVVRFVDVGTPLFSYTLRHGPISGSTQTTVNTFPRFSMAGLSPASLYTSHFREIIEYLRADRVTVEVVMNAMEFSRMMNTTETTGLQEKIRINQGRHSFWLKIEKIETNGVLAKIKGLAILK